MTTSNFKNREENMRIPFQGDSITDCLRSSYDSGTFVGSGYSCLI